jgi:putative redox protein
MKVALKWQGKMRFDATARGNTTPIDARSPIGSDSAPSPKELLLSALAGCTAIDVVGLLRTRRQGLEHFELDVDAETANTEHPRVFTAAKLTFRIDGAVEPNVALEAIAASQTKYCGVSAMLSRAFPISYELILNGTSMGVGRADFGSNS